MGFYLKCYWEYNSHNSPKNKRETVQKPGWFLHLVSCSLPATCVGIINCHSPAFSPKLLGSISDAGGRGLCWAPHTFPFGKREMWLTIGLVDSFILLCNVSCPCSVPLADLPVAEPLSPSVARVCVGGARGGEKAVGDICQLSSLIKELMRLTMRLLWREPIPALTKRYVSVFLLFVGLTGL